MIDVLKTASEELKKKIVTELWKTESKNIKITSDNDIDGIAECLLKIDNEHYWVGFVWTSDLGILDDSIVHINKLVKLSDYSVIK